MVLKHDIKQVMSTKFRARMQQAASLRTVTHFCRRFIYVFAAIYLGGCKQNAPTPPSLVQQRAHGNAAQIFDPWILTARNVADSRGNCGIFLGNGFLGAGFGANGGADATTKCFVAGVYNDEHLARLPNWNKLGLAVTNENYSQSLDLKRGVLTTRCGSIKVISFVSLPRRNLAILHVEGASLPEKLTPIDIPNDWILVKEKVVSIHEKRWKLKTTDGKTTLQMRVREIENSKQSWTRFVQIESGNRVLDAPPNYEMALKEHEIAWRNRWQASIQIDGDAKAQQLVHALMFNLLCCVRENTSDSIPPEAFFGDHYLGHIFWDAEIWMFPALLAQHPKLAKTILDYRFEHLIQAKRDAQNAGFKGVDFP